MKARQSQEYSINPYLNKIHEEYLVTEEEAIEWHHIKDEHGPAFAGNRSWKQYMVFVETKLRDHGVVDIERNSWIYDRWYTSEWPDSSKWSLISNGTPIKVASYGANSGSTSKEGLSAELIYYETSAPPEDMAGKIVVFQTVLRPNMVNVLAGDNWEYRHESDTYPERGKIVPDEPESQITRIFAQLIQTVRFIETAKNVNAAGALFVLDAGEEQMSGIYTFPVPSIYNIPTLFLDRATGAQVIEDANKRAKATLILLAEIRPTETWQLLGYLPGRHYGTEKDEIIQIITHSDGPSISQENGPYGLLGLAKYFSHIPQSERPRTLMFFFDCRHYMPGMERSFAKEDYFAKYPKTREKVIAVIGMEHLGMIEFMEKGEKILPSGRVDHTFVWASHNQNMIDFAIKAVKENELKGATVRCVDRLGISGGKQGMWYGMSAFANRSGTPAFGMMGSMGAYWATSSRIDRFDPQHFCTQVATGAQLTGELMIVDVKDIQSSPPEVKNELRL